MTRVVNSAIDVAMAEEDIDDRMPDEVLKVDFLNLFLFGVSGRITKMNYLSKI